MLSRRDFVSRGTVTLLLAPIMGCASSGYGYGSSGGSGGCTGVESTSSLSFGHSHTVCVSAADLANPAAGGATYTTSGPAPTHTVALTAAQLSAINLGQSVTVTTSTDGGHSHQFVLSKM